MQSIRLPIKKIKHLLAQDLSTHNHVALREHGISTHLTQLLYIVFLVEIHL